MVRRVIKTTDGSSTIYIEELNEHYHSKHGAIREAMHVFIKSGLLFHHENFKNKNVDILEIGFGTGLNAFLTLIESEKFNIEIDYTGVEAFPVDEKELSVLNYSEILNEKYSSHFSLIHQSKWNKRKQISKSFNLLKRQQKFEDIDDTHQFDLIYFDAFGPRVQPNLWCEEMFIKMYKALKDGGILVTYSAKGSVRRAMQSVGFYVEKLPGPPGKREMLRAIKKSC